MSGTAGAAPPTVVLGLDLRGPWHQRSTEEYLLTGSVKPPPTAAGGGGGWGSRTPLRLPALVATSRQPHRRSSMARLSLSEPSLITTNQNILSEGFSRHGNCHSSVLQKRPPPPPPFSKSSLLLPCKTCPPSRTNQPHQREVQSCSRPGFIHFTRAIQPSSKPRPVRRHSHNPASSADTCEGHFRPPLMKSHNAFCQEEPLTVVGKPCLLSCSERPGQGAAAGPARTQLHVFLPTEAEGEEVDRESVDEGFMDELDGKMTSLKIQQAAPKTVTL